MLLLRFGKQLKSFVSIEEFVFLLLLLQVFMSGFAAIGYVVNGLLLGFEFKGFIFCEVFTILFHMVVGFATLLFITQSYDHYKLSHSILVSKLFKMHC